jgi:hypothetical protein
MEDISNKILEISYQDYLKLPEAERSRILKIGLERCKEFAESKLAEYSNLDYAFIYYSEKYGFQVFKMGKYRDIPSTRSGNSFYEHLKEEMKDSNKLLFDFFIGPLVEGVIIEGYEFNW